MPQCPTASPTVSMRRPMPLTKRPSACSRAAYDEDALWLSGRLFRRVTGVGAAYELHVLLQLQDADAVRLSRPECQSLVDELQFVAERLDDPLAHRMVQTVAALVSARLRQPGWDENITIDGD